MRKAQCTRLGQPGDQSTPLLRDRLTELIPFVVGHVVQVEVRYAVVRWVWRRKDFRCLRVRDKLLVCGARLDEDSRPRGARWVGRKHMRLGYAVARDGARSSTRCFRPPPVD